MTDPAQLDAAAKAVFIELKDNPTAYRQIITPEAMYYDGEIDCRNLAEVALKATPGPCDRVEQARASRPPVKLPDRDELARALFIADNSSQPRDQSVADFEQLKLAAEEGLGTFYVYPLADAVIAEFRRLNP